MTELKRLINRARDLILSGSTQGAETVLDYVLTEIDKIFKETPEGCTPSDARVLRKANHDLIDENHRLKTVIYEANAQEPVGSFNGKFYGGVNGALTFEVKCFDSLPKVGDKLYARPIPAQQSYDKALQLIAESRKNFEKQFGVNGYADWIYKDLAELFIVDLPVQQSPAADVPADCLSPTVPSSRRYGQPTARHMQSPAVGAPDDWKNLVKEMCDRFHEVFPEFDDQDVAHLEIVALLDRAKSFLSRCVPSPRITEQDAREILRDHYEHIDNPAYTLDWYIETHGRALLNRLNNHECCYVEVGSDENPITQCADCGKQKHGKAGDV